MWNDKTLIWGGDCYGEISHDIFCHYGEKGEWVGIRPSGDGPTHQYGHPAEVVNDTMYIMDQRPNVGRHTMFALANYWQSTKNNPEGLPPLRGTKHQSSWHYGGKIYYFGGEFGYD